MDHFFPFQFFMKATQLEQLKDDFVHIKSTRSVTSEKVDQYSEVIIIQDWFSFIWFEL